MNPVQFIRKKIKSVESIKTEEIDSGKMELEAPLQNSGLAINREAMGTTEPVTAEDSIEKEF
jgi:hypothetical protein